MDIALQLADAGHRAPLRPRHRRRPPRRSEGRPDGAGDLPRCAEPVLRPVSDVHTYYGDSHVLQGVSLAVAPRRGGRILGRNGMGKTTLIRSIIGFTPPRRGQVASRAPTSPAGRRTARSSAAWRWCPQGRRVFPSLSVRENLEVARGAPGPLDRSSASMALFPRLRERAEQSRQQALGRRAADAGDRPRLMTNPDLLLMDEPTEGLAPLLVARGGAGDRPSSSARGLCILLVEQNLPMAARGGRPRARAEPRGRSSTRDAGRAAGRRGREVTLPRRGVTPKRLLHVAPAVGDHATIHAGAVAGHAAARPPAERPPVTPTCGAASGHPSVTVGSCRYRSNAMPVSFSNAST